MLNAKPPRNHQGLSTKERWAEVYERYGPAPDCRIRTRDAGHHCVGPIQMMHITPRKLDRGVVNPLDVMPGCRLVHDQYDGRHQARLDLIPYMTSREQARAVERLGSLERAIKHCSGRQLTVERRTPR